MLKASVIGLVLAAALIAPEAAHAYGRNGGGPNLFSDGVAGAGQTAAEQKPARIARYWRPRHAALRYAWRRHPIARASWTQHAWLRHPQLRYRAAAYRVASLSPVGAPPQSPGVAETNASASLSGAAEQPRSFDGGGVVAEASHWIGSGKFTRLPGPWCADAVNAWLERSGHRPLSGRMASAALSYGPRLGGPEVGSIAVLGSRRGWAYHVGIVSGVEPDGSIRLISGNWGRRVAEAIIPRRSVSAFVGVR